MITTMDLGMAESQKEGEGQKEGLLHHHHLVIDSFKDITT